MRSGSRRSFVWKYFKKVTTHTSRCLICNKELRDGGNGNTAGGTTNFKQHLIRVHPNEIDYNESLDAVSTIERDNDANESFTHARPSTSQDNQRKQYKSAKNLKIKMKTEKARPAAKQLKVFGAKSKFEPAAHEISPRTEQLLKMICTDFQPISIVESQGFLEFVALGQPPYKPPDKKTLSNTIIPEYYEKEAAALRALLENIKHVAITIDIWTTEDSNITNVTITAHFIHNDERYARTLATRPIPLESSQNTQEDHVGNVLLSILNEWGVFDKTVTVVSDNATDIKEIVTDYLNKDYQPCAAHRINRTVCDAIKGTVEFDELLTKCRQLVAHFRDGSPASEQLKDTQQQMDMPVLKVKQDVAIRWNSSFVMLERLLEIKDPICVTYQIGNLSNPPSFPDPNEWEIIKDCVEILKPAYDLTVVLSGEKYPAISMVIPLVRGFQFAVSSLIPSSAAGQQLQELLAQGITERLGSFEKDQIVSKATFLDPRFRKLAFDLPENAENAEKWVSEEVHKLFTEKLNNEQMECNNTYEIAPQESAGGKAVSVWTLFDSKMGEIKISTPQPAAQPQTESAKKVNVWSLFDSKVGEMQVDSTPDHLVALTIKQYLTSAPLPRNRNPMEFWAKQKDTLPELYQLAKKYLCIPATSVQSERLFTKAGQLKNERRNRLSPKNLDHIIFINSCM